MSSGIAGGGGAVTDTGFAEEPTTTIDDCGAEPTVWPTGNWAGETATVSGCVWAAVAAAPRAAMSLGG